MKRPTVPQSDILGWLAANYPALHEACEVERSWVWLVADLRGPCRVKGCPCEKCETARKTREAIKEKGFAWAKFGHTLPSGRIGTWGHSCEAPIPFRRRGSRNGGGHKPEEEEQQETERPAEEFLDAATLAFLNS